MIWLKSIMSWLKQGKVARWESSDKELSREMGGAPRVGSFSEQSGDGEKYKGIKITLPLPEKR